MPLPADGGATSVSCTFTPPGLHQGEAIAGASLLGLAALAGYGWWRRRSRGAWGDESDGDSDLGASDEPVTARTGRGVRCGAPD